MLLRPATQALGTIFHQDWWLEAATYGAWNKVEVKHSERTAGIWSYAIRRRHHTTRLDMPPYTRVLGPVINLPETKPVTRLESAREVVGDLLTKMPRHDLLFHMIAPEFDESPALTLAGANVEQGYTFRFPASVSEDTVLRDMKGSTRRDINYAQSRLTVETHYDLDQYIAMAIEQIGKQQNRRNEHRFAILTRLFEACVMRNQAMVLTAREGKEAKAVAILLHDDYALYFWLGTRKVEPSNRAYTYLIWEGFRVAQARGLIFDLDGIWTPSSGRFVASFGAVPVQRPIVTYYSSRYAALMLGRQLLARATASVRRAKVH